MQKKLNVFQKFVTGIQEGKENDTINDLQKSLISRLKNGYTVVIDVLTKKRDYDKFLKDNGLLAFKVSKNLGTDTTESNKPIHIT